MKKVISCVAVVLVIVIIAVLMIGRTKAVIPSGSKAEINAVLYSSGTGLTELHPDDVQKQKILDLFKPLKAERISAVKAGGGDFLTTNVVIQTKDGADLRTINVFQNSERDNNVAIGDKLYKLENSGSLYDDLRSILGL
ncbi:MAG: hypothetical protein IJM80_03790 [Firmicutes bacterium]|nr:hypothetical protein [Bacillota bacterium]